jgi:hypothetical protein
MRKISFLILFSFLLCFICVAQEEITLTTYYPSPDGVYRSLRAETLTVENDNEEIIIGGDTANPSITLRHLGGGGGNNPYISFATDTSEDYRIGLQGNDRINLRGGEVYIMDDSSNPETIYAGGVWYCNSF